MMKCHYNMINSTILLIGFWIHFLVNSEGAVVQYSRMRKGLTEIPSDIPCNVQRILLWINAISRIEANSFPCQTEVQLIDLRFNSLVYIDADAFQFCSSLLKIYLTGNEHLTQLPPSFGPNSANMEDLWLRNLNLNTFPNGFCLHFESLLILTISVAGSLDNDALKGLSSLIRLNIGRHIVPNMTGHLPRLEKFIFDLPEIYVPAENVYGLQMLDVEFWKPWTYIPAFDGAMRLQKVDAADSLVEELPDLSQHHGLKELKVDTSQFQCNPKCCWMLFEDISAEGLAGIPNITCQGPPDLFGRKISNISTLDARCFESKLLRWIL